MLSDEKEAVMTEYIIHDEVSRTAIIEIIRGLDLKRRWRLDLKRYVKRRSNNQNNLYWQWMTEIGDYTGYTKEEMHDFFREKFLAPVPMMVGTSTERPPRSTTSLTTAEMQDYLDRIYRFAVTDIGVRLTLPEYA